MKPAVCWNGVRSTFAAAIAVLFEWRARNKDEQWVSSAIDGEGQVILVLKGGDSDWSCGPEARVVLSSPHQRSVCDGWERRR